MPVNYTPSSGGSGSVGAPEYGYANLANQTVATSAYADVTGSSMALTPGTWEITYTVVADHTSGTTGVPHIIITDSANAVVDGSQRSRPGSSTTAQTLAAVIVLTVASAATYKLRISNGGSGTLTLLNATTSKSTLAWVKLAGLGAGVSLNDQSASGYFDLGNTRIQWGTFTQGSTATGITLPAAFADTSYVVTGNVQDSTANTAVYGTTFSGKTTTGFSSITNAHNGVTVNTSASRVIGYQAIGLKP